MTRTFRVPVGFFPCLFSMLLLACTASAAEYHVGKSGNDANAGTKTGEAFLTIQRGLDALEPGDTLTIAPGEYREAASRKGLGNAEKETVIRAAIPGTALIRGDVAIQGFERAGGMENVYVADFDGDVQAVNELDTLTAFTSFPGPGDLPFLLSGYHYDAATKKLYIATSDMKSAERHQYSVSVIPKHGLFLDDPVRVIVDGLAVTGFQSAKEISDHSQYAIFGIFLMNARNCLVQNVTAFMNGGGIGINSGSNGGNIIQDCVGYGNFYPGSNEGGNILVFAPQGDIIRRCLAYKSRGNGLRLYGGGGTGSLIEDSLGWGNQTDFFIKGSAEYQPGIARRVVAVGVGNAVHLANDLIGGSNSYVPVNETPKDTIRLRGAEIDSNAEFADSVNFDFRLQKDSRFRGAAPDGGDCGPFPYKGNIYYVKPAGDDAADGLSLQSAWKTTARALKNLKAGDTLYLEPGIYAGGMKISAAQASGKEPLCIRGRGVGRVILQGEVTVEGARNVKWERLNFQGAVVLRNGEAVTFENCRFFAKANALTGIGCRALRVTHCEFTGFKISAMRLEDSKAGYFSSNIYDNSGAPAIILEKNKMEEAIAYSNYNSYAKPTPGAMNAGKAVSFADLQQGSDTESRILKPEYKNTDEGPILKNARSFIVGGALGKSLGVHQELLLHEVQISPPKVYSVGATTANIEWRASGSVLCEIAWGDTPDCENSAKYLIDGFTGFFASYSLTGLAPGKTYYFQIRTVSLPQSGGADPLPVEVAPDVKQAISFTTLKDAKKPAVYHVSPNGNDANTGLSVDAPWKTIQHAADKVSAGDTVLIGAGNYAECVYARVTGEEGQPITFKNAPGVKVVFVSAGRQLLSAWIVNGKKHLNFDGLYFEQFGPTGGGPDQRLLNFYGCDQIAISRCFSNQRGPGYPSAFLKAHDSNNLTVSNCVVLGGFDGLYVQGCDNFRFEHSVLIRPLTMGTQIGLGTDAHGYLADSIFTDSQPYKVKAGVPYHEWSGWRGIVDENNCYYLSIPDGERKMYWLLNFIENEQNLGHTRMSLTEYQKRGMAEGGVTPSIVADPKFAVLEKPEWKEKIESNYPMEILFDIPNLDFPDFFATNPEVTKRGIGLQPDSFRDYPLPQSP